MKKPQYPKTPRLEDTSTVRHASYGYITPNVSVARILNLGKGALDFEKARLEECNRWRAIRKLDCLSKSLGFAGMGRAQIEEACNALSFLEGGAFDVC